MSWPFIVLLVVAAALVVAAEWERVAGRLARDGRDARRRRPHLTLVRSEPPTDVDEFEASVQRDLEQLPTIEERDRRR